MNVLFKFMALLVCATGIATAFIIPAPRFGRLQRLHMSSPDPMDAIREKMKSDPNYHPLQDPQAMQVLENSVPSEIKELMGAIERVKVAIKDATSGANAVTDLNKVASELIKERVEELSTIVDEVLTQRAESRIGQSLRILIEDAGEQEGRADHQGPDVDGSTFIKSRNKYRVGEYVDAVVSDVNGADLIAQVI